MEVRDLALVNGISNMFVMKYNQGHNWCESDNDNDETSTTRHADASLAIHVDYGINDAIHY